MKCDVWWSTFDGSDTCGIDSFLHGSPNTRMIRADSSVDAPASFEVSISAPWLRHHASHVPRDVSFRRCSLLQMQAVLYLGLLMSTEDLLHIPTRYPSAISARCQMPSSPLCAFLGFLLLRHYVRISTILRAKCGVLHGRLKL